ncbi:isopeptide-forming domain-containing fimbrial protein [Companilactobacillus suantsaicola]|uniref:Isopeptide-forming domain-containing fimbrial protein n=1 Tax=Companilactobacillus suantsaicola TaxID=2487723 RepID=A0A4Z0JNK7_9LACO|nr:isopeptide-forming domain-containing fimbrial protein [Companilactobacillus suantsaicola]TGD23774.1 isopeptide-forming domain-containing fimbrial protein [Companilactobacillus suantsaicola]
MKNSQLRVILFPLLFLAMFIIVGTQSLTKVNADSQAETVAIMKKINDGISNWDYKTQYTNPKNVIGKIPIGDGLSLDYTFGAAQNQNGTVMAGDNTIATDHKISQGLQTYSKINIFLEHNNQYYGIIHQNKNAYIGTGGQPYTASDSSLDFAVVTGSLTLSGANYGVMGQTSNKVFATGTDSKQRTVLKIGGKLNNPSNMYAEVVLRPNPSGAPIVQRELYLYNNTSNDMKMFQVYFGEDTALGKDPSIVDDVPLYAIGNDEGLYMYDTQTPSNSGSKLYVTNNVADGFNSYMGKAYVDSGLWNLKGFAEIYNGGQIANPNLKYKDTTNGDNGRPAGSKLLFGTTENSNIVYPVVNGRNGDKLQDSAYTLRWPLATEDNPLKPGQTAHYASTMGATLAGYPIPSVSKTYTNENPHADGLVHIGDRLKFTLKAKNDGLKSNWSLTDIRDALPKGLDIDTSSINYKWTEMTTGGSDQHQKDTEKTIASGTIPSMYVTSNSLGDTLDYTPTNTVLKEKDQYYVTFYATVNNKAPFSVDSSKNLVNEASFTGFNADTNKDNKTFTASVNIPILTTGFNYSFTNQVRNVTTDPTGTFDSEVDAHQGDIVEFKSTFTGTQDIAAQSIYTNILNNSDLSLISGSVFLNGAMQPDSIGKGIYLSKTTATNSNTIMFRAKVNKSTSGTIENRANMNSVTSSSGTFNNLLSDKASINVQEDIPSTSFVEVPEFIDFGSINSTGNERMLTNKQTKGNLIVSHSAETPFEVLVSYDNNGDQAINNGNEKLVQDNGLSLMLNNNANESQDKWTPLSQAGVPIANKDFTGSSDELDLTKYVGLDKWKLRVPGTAQSGKYSGQVTWTIADTVS